jgi:hypothetical protein
MMVLPSPEPTGSFLEGEFREDQAARGATVERGSDGEFVIHVSAGQPLYYDLEALHAAQGTQLPVEVRFDLLDFQFFLVRLALTLHHNPNAGATELDVAVQLTNLTQGNLPLPLVYDLNPREITEPVEVESKTSITSGFKFQGIGLESAGAVVLKYQQLIPKITPFGMMESVAKWRLAPANDRFIRPGIKEFNLIVRKSRKDKVNCRVWIAGQGRATGLLGLFLRPDLPGSFNSFYF